MKRSKMTELVTPNFPYLTIKFCSGWFDKDPSKDTLEKLLQAEIDGQTTTKGGSATDALLWLKRGLWMMAHFMNSMLQGDK